MPVDVAPRLGVNHRSVRQWRASYEGNGKQGMTARPAPGRRARLDAEAMRRLEALLLGGARACGFPTDLWTCLRVAKVIRTEELYCSLAANRYVDVPWVIDFVGEVLCHLKGPVVGIWDRLSVHRSRGVSGFIRRHRRLDVDWHQHCPPVLNPVEIVRHHLT
jgi:hypothetical protein